MWAQTLEQHGKIIELYALKFGMVGEGGKELLRHAATSSGLASGFETSHADFSTARRMRIDLNFLRLVENFRTFLQALIQDVRRIAAPPALQRAAPALATGAFIRALARAKTVLAHLELGAAHATDSRVCGGQSLGAHLEELGLVLHLGLDEARCGELLLAPAAAAEEEAAARGEAPRGGAAAVPTPHSSTTDAARGTDALAGAKQLRQLVDFAATLELLEITDEETMNVITDILLDNAAFLESKARASFSLGAHCV